MRVISWVIIALNVVLTLPAVYCQSSTELTLNESMAKARALLQQVFVEMGGQAFHDIRDSYCNGQIAEFGHDGNVVIFTPFREMWLLPDKRRTEYASNGHILVRVFNGKEGWTLDETGISDESDDDIKDFADIVRFGMFSILLSRGSEGTLTFRYAGKDSIDGKPVEWIESSDQNQTELRLAIEEATHLPLQWVISSRDPDSDGVIVKTISYAEFTTSGGVQTPLNISYVKNSRLISELLIGMCKYNSNLSPELFTRSSLERCQKESAKKRPTPDWCSP